MGLFYRLQSPGLFVVLFLFQRICLYRNYEAAAENVYVHKFMNQERNSGVLLHNDLLLN